MERSQFKNLEQPLKLAISKKSHALPMKKMDVNVPEDLEVIET
jgi:hypothetical protein